MSEAYSDIQRLFKDNVNNRVFSCIDYSEGKNHDIDLVDVINFYRTYCESCFGKDLSTWNELPILSIGEKTENYMPIIGDFLFKFDGDTNSNTFFDEKLPYSIMNVFQDVIQDMFNISLEGSEMICVYLQSPVWYENGSCCTKLRFQFPYCKTSRKVIDSVFRNKVVKALRESGASKLFTKSTPVGDWDSQLERTKDSYTLYGSTNNPKTRPPLLYRGVYTSATTSGNCKLLNISDVFNYKRHSFIHNENCNLDDVDTIDEECDIEDDNTFSIYTLPMFLSLYYYPGITRMKSSTSSEIEEENEPSTVIEDEEDSGDIKNDYDMCNELVQYLSKKRFNDKQCFMDIGRAYFNATEGSYKGLHGWIKTCQKSETFDKNFCEENYDAFEEDKVTVRTLAWYFKADDPKKYENWHNRWCYYSFFDAIERDHTKVGEAFYKKNWLKYMFTGKKWYEFRRNRLVVIDEIKLKKSLTNDFIPSFDMLETQLLGEKMKLNDRKSGSRKVKQRIQEIEKNIEDIIKLRKSLRNESYIASILKSVRTFFYYENIHKVLNKNPRLIGCSNCVIELTEEKAVKREGKPEDFITKKTGVPFRSDYTFDHPDVKDLLKYLMQVFPNPDIRSYMEKDFASLLYRRNVEKLFRLWIGDTNGSKSILQNIIRKWLGDYYCDIPTEFYSAKKMGTSGPTPELAQAEDSAVAFSAEPDDDEQFKGARIKKMSGGDSMYARLCNEDGGSFETTFKTIMVLNSVPDITGMDEATKTRLVMIPFEGRWIRPEEEHRFPVPDTFEEQVRQKTYRMDGRFGDNVPRLASAMLWFAYVNYKKYLQEGLKQPTYIKTYMDDYWSKNDPYSSFINEMMEIPKKADGNIDMDKHVTATDIYPVFTRWFKGAYPKHPVTQKNKFTTLMTGTDRLGKQKARRWYGWTLKSQDVNNTIFE